MVEKYGWVSVGSERGAVPGDGDAPRGGQLTAGGGMFQHLLFGAPRQPSKKTPLAVANGVGRPQAGLKDSDEDGSGGGGTFPVGRGGMSRAATFSRRLSALESGSNPS